jgi:GT2 family glycosyltransferase
VEKQNKESRAANPGYPASDPKQLSERSWKIKNFVLPRFLRWAVPQPLIGGLRELKARALTRGTVWDFPRHIEFEQSPEDALASKSMSIIVPIHDAPAITHRCLASLERYARQSEIVLVNDGSRLPETLEVISQFRNRNGWKVVHHDTPLGHSSACRAGVMYATREYLCLLNSDTVVTPWCWRRIKEKFDCDETIGIAGPSSSFTGNVQTLPLASALSLYWNDGQICAFAKQLLATPPEPVVTNVAWVSGFAFFLRRSLWEAIGGFDPNLPDFGNEIELCKRVAKIGLRNVWISNSYIHHLGGQSYGATIGVDAILARIRNAEVYIAQK